MPSTSESGWATGLLLRHPRRVLACFLLLTLVLGVQARNFRIDASADTLLTRDNELYIFTKEVGERYSPEEFLLVAYEPTTHELWSQQTLTHLQAMEDSLLQLDRVVSVKGLHNVPLFELGGGGVPISASPGEWTLENRDVDWEQVQEIFTGHPIYEDLLVNRNQTATALQVLFRSDPELGELQSELTTLELRALERELTDQEQHRLVELESRIRPLAAALDQQRFDEVEEIREIVAPYEDQGRIYLGGVHVLAFQLIEIIKSDLWIFGSGIVVAIFLLLIGLFRQLRWALLPLLCCACSVVLAMGLFALLGLATTVISSNFIALQLVLTLAIALHLIVRFNENQRENEDWSRERLVAETLRQKARPCLYAGITTSIGFAALLISGLQPVIAFGWMMTIAMAISIVTGLVLFPSVSLLFGGDRHSAATGWARSAMRAAARLTIERPVALSITTVLLLVAAAFGMSRLVVEHSFLDYFDADTRVHEELEFVDQHFGGSTPLDIVCSFNTTPPSGDLILTADVVRGLRKVQDRLRERQAVGKVMSVVNFLELAQDLNQGRPLTEYELTAAYWSLDESVRESLLGSYLASERDEVRFGVRIRDSMPGLNRAEFVADLRNDLSSLREEGLEFRMVGLFILYQDILQRLFQSQFSTLALVQGLLFATFWLIFRSLRLALIGMVPNVITSVLILGTMGWLGIPLDLMTITITAVAMGIAVDDTIHYMHRYVEEAEMGSDVVVRCHEGVGVALLLTTLIIAVGFSLLACSDFVPSVYFGLLTAAALVIAFLADVLLLPVLLKRFWRGGS